MDEIKRAINLLIPSGQVAELRILGAASNNGGYVKNYYGYFNDYEKMAAAAEQYGKNAPAVYITLQAPKDELLARAANRRKEARGRENNSTKDAEITDYNWFPIDLDPVRPKGISSSEEEKAYAYAKVSEIVDYLDGLGFPEPVIGDSGNGYHILYMIELKNTQEVQDLLKNCLVALGERFTDEKVAIDGCNFNPSRIWKLYGTMAKKGDDTPLRPHRQSQILHEPETPELTMIEQLRALAATKKQEEKPQTQKSITSRQELGNEIDIVDFCNSHGLNIEREANWKDGIKYHLHPCPFNSDHDEAILIKHPSGAVSFKCQHNGCIGRDWQQLREMYEPKAERQRTEYRQDYAERMEPRQKLVRQKENAIEGMKKDIVDVLGGRLETLPLPWTFLSYGCQALRPGTVTVIAGALKTGKSYFTMNIVNYLHHMGVKWAYLPLEDDKKAWLWRMLAIETRDYTLTDISREAAKKQEKVLEEYQDFIIECERRVTQNPRVGVKNAAGETVIPRVSGDDVLEWIKKAAKKNRVIVVDPMSQIEFLGAKPWEQEADFIRKALGIVSDTQASLIIVAHTVKRAGMMASIFPSAEDVQGSAMLTRLAHTTLVLTRCEKQVVEVKTTAGICDLEVNRILLIAAARNGNGTDACVGFIQREDEPTFTEIGILTKKKKRKKKEVEPDKKEVTENAEGEKSINYKPTQKEFNYEK